MFTPYANYVFLPCSTWVDQIEENGLGGTSSTHGEMTIAEKNLVGNPVFVDVGVEELNLALDLRGPPGYRSVFT